MTGPVHFIGIGGYGMSSLAQYLLLSGVAVTGSDVRPSVRTERLAALGARIAFGHKAEHVAGAARVIYSTDVPEENVERIAARRHGIPVEHRSVLLAELLARGRSVAVTGTHGKTTTTAMIGAVLVEAGCDPTVFLGADYGPFGGNLRFGRGLWSVAEACESDASFLRYRPDIAVVTNLEPEHLDRYGDFPALVEAVRRFLGGVAADGCVVLCGDDPHLRRLATDPARAAPALLYGFGPDNDVRGVEVRREGGGWACRVRVGGREWGEVRLRVPGRHNLSNALAAVAVGTRFRLPANRVSSALGAFAGAHRRFQVVGVAGGVTVIDDYAHHPTEIRATIAAARERYGGRLIAVFQPQRYSRTRLLFEQFADAFHGVDRLLLTEIYAPAGDRAVPGVSGAALAREVERRNGPPVSFYADRERLRSALLGLLEPGDTLLLMGAGDIGSLAPALLSALGERARAS